MYTGQIAICVSGETRDFNDNKTHWLSDVERIFGRNNVDFYGHTWSHCEAPEVNYFKKIEQTDQVVIDHWADRDPDRRLFKHDIPPHLQPQATRAAFGQLWSNKLCMDLVPVEAYDLVIRYRWDIGLFEGHAKRFPNNFLNAINLLQDINTQQMHHDKRPCEHSLDDLEAGNIVTDIKEDYPFCVATMPFSFDYLEDQCIWFDRHAHKRIVQRRIETDLVLLIQKDGKPSSHQLWKMYIDELGINPFIKLPLTWSRMFWESDMSKEFAKVWSI
jgi:hypothetical protein